MIAAGQPMLEGLTKLVGWEDAPCERVHFLPTPTALATRLPIADMAALALGAVGMAGAEILARRGGPDAEVGVDRFAASLAMCANDYLAIDGAPAKSWPELTGFYRAADGWVYVHTGFPSHGDRLLAEFGVPNERAALTERLASLPAQQIEDRAIGINACAARLRTRAEWEAHAHRAVIASAPVIAMAPLGRGAPGWTGADTPLAGLRVLDLSRVLAGPTIGRTLAEHGAEVLRISAPHLDSIEPLVIDTGYGKRAAFADLETAEGRAALTALIEEADVLIDGYRPGALARHGLTPAEIDRLRPGIVHLTLSAFGESGPWAGRRGYDSLVQATTGLAAGDPPARLPCQPLDYLAGYLGAFAVMAALLSRGETGEGAQISLTLAGLAHWVWEMSETFGGETAAPERNPAAAEIGAELCHLPSAFGEITALRPALDVPWRPRTWPSPAPLGTDAPEWT